MTWLARWLSRRSLRFLHALGALLGWLVWLLAPSYRARLAENARRAGVSEAEARAAVAEAGRMSLEMPRLWLRPAGAPIADPVQWDGAELVEQALAAGRGIVLLAPHMGSFEIVGQAYAERFGTRQPMTALYRPSRNDWLRELEETARARPFMATAPSTLGGVRQLLRALRQGQTLGLLPDQVPPEGMGVWAPFFGREAYTMTLAARLLRQTGATPLGVWGERLPRGQGYCVHVLALPEAAALAGKAGEGADAERADAEVINRAMEAVIARKPSQYLWGYHRYKNPRRLEGAA